MPFKVPPQVLNLMAKLVEEGEMAMGIAEESEWLGNMRRIGENDGEKIWCGTWLQVTQI